MTCPAEPTTPSPGSGEGFRSREIYGIGLYVLSVFCFCSMDVVGKLLLENLKLMPHVQIHMPHFDHQIVHRRFFC